MTEAETGPEKDSDLLENIELLTDILSPCIKQGLERQLSAQSDDYQELRGIIAFIVDEYVLAETDRNSEDFEDRVRTETEELFKQFRQPERWLTDGVINEEAARCAENLIGIMVHAYRNARLGVRKRKTISAQGKETPLPQESTTLHGATHLNRWLLPYTEDHSSLTHIMEEYGVSAETLETVLHHFAGTLTEREISLADTGLHLHRSSSIKDPNLPHTVRYVLKEHSFLSPPISDITPVTGQEFKDEFKQPT